MYSSDEDCNSIDSVDIYQPKEEKELEISINNLTKYKLYKFTFFIWLINAFVYVIDKLRFKKTKYNFS